MRPIQVPSYEQVSSNNQAFFDAGWTEGNLVDAIVVIGDKIISNYLHGTTKVPVDFPTAPALA